MIKTDTHVASMGGEGQDYVSRWLARPKDVGLPRLWALKPELFRLTEDSLSAKVSKRIRKEWYCQLNDRKRPIYLEKSIVNSARIRWINKYFDEPFFVAIIRNPYAVCEGIHRKAGHGYELCANQWLKSNEIMLNDLSFVNNKLVMRYEDLVSKPEVEINRVYSAIGLDRKKFLDLKASRYEVHGKVGNIRNMNDESILRLTDDDKNIINRVIGDFIVKYGYSLL